MKDLRIVLLCLFGFIAIVTVIILIVYLATFNKGVSANTSNWDLFLTLYNGIIITLLTIANIWVFYKLTIAVHYCPVKILDLEINRVDHHPLGR